MIVHIYQNSLSYLYESLFDLKLVIVTFLNEYTHVVIVFKNNLYERKIKKIKIFTNLLKIFFKASQRKVVSVCFSYFSCCCPLQRGRFAGKNFNWE